MSKIKQKHIYLASFGFIATVLSLLPIGDKPAIAQLLNSGITIAQNLQQPKVNLFLVAELKQISKNNQGKEVVSWKDLGAKAQVKSNDILRFSVTAKNEGKAPAKSLTLTQPIRPGMVYILGSATPINGTSLTYSIDQGKTFVANPTVKVTLANGKIEERPAPAQAYTHVRWNFSQQLEPNATAKAAYLVKVR